MMPVLLHCQQRDLPNFYLKSDEAMQRETDPVDTPYWHIMMQQFLKICVICQMTGMTSHHSCVFLRLDQRSDWR